METIKFKCAFCEREFNTKQALGSHTGKCKNNPNAKEHEKSDAWYEAMAKRRGHGTNQFTKAKELGKELKWSDEIKEKIGQSNTGKHLSEESKKKISEARKRYLEKRPEKVPFKLNHSSKESYPERYFREWLQKENIFSEQEYQVGRYSLDFAWPEKMVYLEIDGSQHSLDWMQNHDKVRTEKLSEKGWTCIGRVYWPEYQGLNREDKEKYLKSIKDKLLKVQFRVCSSRAIGATVSARDS